MQSYRRWQKSVLNEALNSDIALPWAKTKQNVDWKTRCRKRATKGGN